MRRSDVQLQNALDKRRQQLPPKGRSQRLNLLVGGFLELSSRDREGAVLVRDEGHVIGSGVYFLENIPEAALCTTRAREMEWFG